MTCVLNTIIFTYESTAATHFPPRDFCTNINLLTLRWTSRMLWRIHSISWWIVFAVDATCVCVWKNLRTCICLVFVISVCVCVHLLDVFMYGVSVCICIHSCPCYCVIQREFRRFNLQATHVFPWAARRPQQSQEEISLVGEYVVWIAQDQLLHTKWVWCVCVCSCTRAFVYNFTACHDSQGSLQCQ